MGSCSRCRCVAESDIKELVHLPQNEGPGGPLLPCLPHLGPAHSVQCGRRVQCRGSCPCPRLFNSYSSGRSARAASRIRVWTGRKRQGEETTFLFEGYLPYHFKKQAQICG